MHGPINIRCIYKFGLQTVSYYAILSNARRHNNATVALRKKVEAELILSKKVALFNCKIKQQNVTVNLSRTVRLSKGGGKQWQTTPKNLPRMQCARAMPVT